MNNINAQFLLEIIFIFFLNFYFHFIIFCFNKGETEDYFFAVILFTNAG